MLTGSNNKALKYKNVNPELIFFYQRWQELLDNRTLDMYQYNILNSCVALAQLISEVVFYIEHKNVDSVEESFSTIIENYNTYIELLKVDHFDNNNVLSDGVIDILN
jgi:hypothetical protein